MLVVAGLDVALFTRMTSRSSNRLVPNGVLISKPLARGTSYTVEYADRLLLEANQAVAAFNETEPVSMLLIYIDLTGSATATFVDRFFPFCLPTALPDYEVRQAKNKRDENTILNRFEAELIAASLRLRNNARMISEHTGVANLTPLLLPVGNFRDQALSAMLRRIFKEGGVLPDPRPLVAEAIKDFHAKSPRRKPPDDERACFSDGTLFFKSPGRAMHGYFRNIAAAGHLTTCLLNARSRVGGSFRHNFHYDCTPVKGALQSSYPGCHHDSKPPKERHVNISPNDYIG